VFHIRSDSGEPIYQQLVRQVKHALATGALAPGDRLPTVRELAARLVVNANTVARAYRELEREGLLDTAPRRGSFLAEAPPRLLVAERRRRLQPFIDQLVAEGRTLGFDGDEILDLVERTVRARAALTREEEARR
jgi:GntR family transcriptional regulator